MRILHTADLHLKNHNDDRWQVLENLIGIGKKENIDIFVICGDLFDKDTDSELLRPHIRTVFSDNKFSVLILPGNHDQGSYREGMYFGKDVTIIQDYQTPFELKEIRIWGLPFAHLAEGEVLKKIHYLSRTMSDENKDILLFHGELLDSFYSRSDFGNEGNDRYMPVRLSYFKDLTTRYVLAGHFHKSFDVRSLPHGGYFVYPGSPISISRKETGRRKVNILNVGDAPNEYLLDSFHYEELALELNPFDDQDFESELYEYIKTIHPSSKVLLKVKGYVNSAKMGKSEKNIVQVIEKIMKDRCEEIYYEFKDIRSVLEDELFKKFKQMLEQGTYEVEKKARLLGVALSAMMEAGA